MIIPLVDQPTGHYPKIGVVYGLATNYPRCGFWPAPFIDLVPVWQCSRSDEDWNMTLAASAA
ncbi:MAG: hypothetical protein WCC31_02755, partial [Terracidiphilus sp.]